MSSTGSDLQNNSVAPTPPPVPMETAAQAFSCVHCPKRFRSNGALQRHANYHHPAFDRCPMQCRFCPFTTSQRLEFFRHHRNCHPDSRTVFYCCPLCNSISRGLGQFYDHCLVHLARNDYEGWESQQDLAIVENLEVGLADESLNGLRDSGPIEPTRLPDLTVEDPGAGTSTSFKDIPKVAEESSNSLESAAVMRPRSNESSMASNTPPTEVPAVMASPANPPSNVHQQQTYQCPYCPEKSQVPNWLQVHVYMCHGAEFPSPVQVMCGHCDLAETDCANLSVHHLGHHVDLPVFFKCPTCGKVYRKRFFYQAHFKSHAISQLLEKHAIPKRIEHSSATNVSQSITCPDCSTTCAGLTGYETHLHEYHADLSIGSNCFAKNSTLSTSSTNDDNNLTPHLDSQQDLQCPLCHRNFADPTKLIRHQEVCILNRGMPSAEAFPEGDDETTSKQDDSDVILVKQETDSYLARSSWYREVVVPESKVYTCAECDEKFDTLALVERHTVTEHCPENLSLLYKCTKCGETFEGFAKFQKHSLKYI